MLFIDGFLVACFLFFVGSVLGWCLEVLFRRFFSAKRWLNPGFLTGPCLPLYGFGLVGLFAISIIPINTGMQWLDDLLIILIMGVSMTLIEYIAGLIFIKGMKIKLWDYSDRWGNIQGIICPLFSLFWLLVGVFFYYVIDAPVIDAVTWFVHHIEFAFVVGIFFGVFFVDLGISLNISMRIKKFAEEHGIVIHFEKLKESVAESKEEKQEKPSFAFPLKSLHELRDDLTKVIDKFTAKSKNNDAKPPKP